MLLRRLILVVAQVNVDTLQVEVDRSAGSGGSSAETASSSLGQGQLVSIRHMKVGFKSIKTEPTLSLNISEVT